MKNNIFYFFLFTLSILSCKNHDDKLINNTGEMPSLDITMAEKLVKLSLDCVNKKYPYKIGYRFQNEKWVKPHYEITPSFYGCWDWHSAVHGHWTMVKILKMFPDISLKNEIRLKLKNNLSKENLEKEYSFFQNEFAKGFERTYGWAWLLKLYSELKSWDDEDGIKWAKNLKPLVDLLSIRTQSFLENLSSPLRPGTHANSAFSFSLMLDYINEVGDEKLKNKINEFSLKYFLNDIDCPVDYEPSGTDFLSPCLAEAETMSKILNNKEFNNWLKKFLPKPESKKFSSIVNPPIVLDPKDPGIGHLIGLMFHRAWTLNKIAASIDGDKEKKYLYKDIASKHAKKGYDIMFDSGYGGEHWLATFAVYCLTYDN